MFKDSCTWWTGIAESLGSFGAVIPDVWKFSRDNHCNQLWEDGTTWVFVGLNLQLSNPLFSFGWGLKEISGNVSMLFHTPTAICVVAQSGGRVTQHPGFCHLGEIKQKFSWQELQCFHCWQTNIFDEGKFLKLLLKHDVILYILSVLRL